MPLSADRVQDHLRGVAVGLLTPFDDDLVIRHDHLAANAQAIASQGIATFLAAANISEYHSLTQAERIHVVETSAEALPSDTCVLAGVGGSTADARELAEAYERIGADALMLMPPDHTYLHERGILEYYRKLAADTDLPLVPYVRGFDPSVQYLTDLTRIDGVVGIKYAVPDPIMLGEAVAAGEDDIVWIDGLAEPFAVSFWAEGAEGFSAGVSNFRPEVGLALYEALSAGEWKRARDLRNICLPFQRLRAERGQDNDIPSALSVSVVKKALELAGLHGGNVREPIRPLSDADARRTEDLYRQLEDDIDRLIR